MVATMAMVLAGRLIAMVEEVAALVVGREYLFLRMYGRYEFWEWSSAGAPRIDLPGVLLSTLKESNR